MARVDPREAAAAALREAGWDASPFGFDPATPIEPLVAAVNAGRRSVGLPVVSREEWEAAVRFDPFEDF